MDYKDAFAIGSRAEGYIKCHYAELHSPDLGVLFSLQDNNFSTKNEAAQKVGAPRTDNSDETIRIMYDVPVVVATEFEDYEKETNKSLQFVPVYLTKYAVNAIKQKLQTVKTTKYIVYRVWDRDDVWHGIQRKKGDRSLMLATYEYQDPGKWMDKYTWGTAPSGYFSEKEFNARQALGEVIYHHEFATGRDIKPKYAELIERIDTNSVFYVKPVAIDWIPTNIINVGLEKDLAEAKRKLDAAKAILATAGAATILL